MATTQINTIELYSDVGHYNFTTELKNKSLNFTIKWNEAIKIWHLDLFDNTNNIQLCLGAPLVLGYEITKQFNWNIGTLFLIDMNSKHDNLDATDATDSDLGDRVKLVWLDN